MGISPLIVAVVFGSALLIVFLVTRTLKKRDGEYMELGLAYDALARKIAATEERNQRLVAENSALRSKHARMRRSLVELPLPNDIGESSGAESVFLPRFRHRGDGLVEVMIPHEYTFGHLIHSDPASQTADECEKIYAVLRKNELARAELGLGLLWKDDSAHAAEFAVSTQYPFPTSQKHP